MLKVPSIFDILSSILRMTLLISHASHRPSICDVLTQPQARVNTVPICLQ